MSEIRTSSAKMERHEEQGFMLVGLIVAIFFILLALSVAAPKVAQQLRREREVEAVHRGNQYVRAIRLYYKKFGAYPPNMEALEKSNEIRFLRKRYKDPATGKDEWHLIHFGENKAPTAMGFFGQPLGGVGGSTLAGTGPGGMGQSAGSSIFGNSGTSSNGIGSVGLSGSNSSSTANTASNSASGNTATGTDPNASSAAGGSTNAGSSIFGSTSTASVSPRSSELALIGCAEQGRQHLKLLVLPYLVCCT